MALVLKDRISETTTTSGTGTITLAGATSGFVAFSTIGDGNTTYYCITDGSAWEVGLGTYASSGNTLARTTVYSNSNGNTSPITLSGGLKNVFGVLPADGIITVSGTSIQVPGTAVLSVANGGTGSNSATFSGANITSINANNVSSGVLAIAQGGTGSSTATFSGENITSLNASSISTGTLGVARGGTGAATLDANNVILGNGTSAVQFVAPGTSANVLTSNGTTWISQAPAAGGGGSYVFIQSASASNSVVDFTGFNNSTYAYFVVYFVDVRATIAIRFYVGGTLITAASYNSMYYQSYEDASQTTANVFFPANAATTARMGGSAIPNTANLGYSGRLYIYPAGGYSSYDFSSAVAASTTTTSTYNYYIYGGGTLTNTSPVDGVRFINITAGNLVTGSFYLYGVKAS